MMSQSCSIRASPSPCPGGIGKGVGVDHHVLDVGFDAGIPCRQPAMISLMGPTSSRPTIPPLFVRVIMPAATPAR